MNTTVPARPKAAAASAVLLAALVIAVALDATIAAIAHASGASHAFAPLQFGSYTALTVLGMLAGTAGWTIVRAKSPDPHRLLNRLVPVLLLLTLVPDVVVGAGSTTGASWGAATALMIMHVTVAALLVIALHRALPLPAATRHREGAATRKGRGHDPAIGRTSRGTM